MHVSLTPNVTDNGTLKVGTTTTHRSLPADAVNKITIPALGLTGNSPKNPVSASAVLSVDVTMTWTPDSSLPADPSPDKIVVLEQSAVSARSGTSTGTGTNTVSPGIASDGLGDAVDANGTSSGHKYVPCTVTNNKATLPPLSLSSSATSASAPPSGTNPDSEPYFGSCSASASMGAIIFQIHAQPYNFRSSGYTDGNGSLQNTAVEDNTNAILSLSYIWSSTDGSNSHLTTCMIKENVTWDSNLADVGGNHTNPDGTKLYAPPSPPVGTNDQGMPLAYPDPTVTQQPATNPGITDTFSPDGAYTGPYKAISWWGDQTYVFSDSDTGETMTPLSGPAAGTFRITRTVAPTGTPSGTTGTLTISTRGHSAGPASLP